MLKSGATSLSFFNECLYHHKAVGSHRDDNAWIDKKYLVVINTTVTVHIFTYVSNKKFVKTWVLVSESAKG